MANIGEWRSGCTSLAILIGAAIGCASDNLPEPHCVASESVLWTGTRLAYPSDVLFVVSDAPSMADEQAALQRQLPMLVHMLATGERGAEAPAPGHEDLHVAVVSATFADGGALHHVPVDGLDACAADYPEFLRYHGAYFGTDRDDPATFVDDFGCVARLGSAGPARNQALQAATSALSSAAVASFVRGKANRSGLSFIGIVVVADTDDCSIPADTASGAVPPASTAACAERAGELESIEHFRQELLALRPENPNLISFGVVTGIPPALVDERFHVDFTDDGHRAAYYERMLGDPAMQPMVDPSAPNRLQPACTSSSASAEPGRRLLQMAQSFGANGAVASLCSDDWSAALEPLFAVGSGGSWYFDLPRPPVRGADGLIDCIMYWDLPSPDLAPEGTPIHCSERPFLRSAAGEPRTPGGERCESQQLAIRSRAEADAVGRDSGGWYYDDFTLIPRVPGTLSPINQAAFTEYARPQGGILVTLACSSLHVVPSDNPIADLYATCRVPDRPPSSSSSLRTASPKGVTGAACMPVVVPEHAFFYGGETVVESGNAQCASGVCMVHRLGATLQPGCDPNSYREGVPRCPTADEIADHVYCSCRCDAHDEAAAACACPQGFSCQEVLAHSGPGLDGSYCIKDDPLESE